MPDAAEAAMKVVAAPASAAPEASCGDPSCTVDHSHGGHDHHEHDHGHGTASMLSSRCSTSSINNLLITSNITSNNFE